MKLVPASFSYFGVIQKVHSLETSSFWPARFLFVLDVPRPPIPLNVRLFYREKKKFRDAYDAYFE